MRLEQQSTGLSFSYDKFRKYLASEELTAGQLNPLNQLLDTLESFFAKKESMVKAKGVVKGKSVVKGQSAGVTGKIDWQPKRS
ncbi:hypothetical protein COL940_013150 [Colletotrichum noveboracense]|nr:hypothetical protein COL940_013150 [Colletotrichum noveboracense]